MNEIALMIVIAAAFLHAGWNYLAKTSDNKAVFIWWFLLLSQLLYLPVLIYYWPEANLSARGWGCILGTGIVHFFYYWFLGRAYRGGDLSLVYPLARGSGPLIVPVLAFFWLGEQITFSGGCGIGLVVAGIFVLHVEATSTRSVFSALQAFKQKPTQWALLAGISIAIYSVIDKIGVEEVPPPLYLFLMLTCTLVLLTPSVLISNRGSIKKEWQLNRNRIFVVAILDPGVYLMILFAMQMTQVSYVVAVRQISIVFSVLYGVFRLGEKQLLQKMRGAVLIALGVVLIGFTN